MSAPLTPETPRKARSPRKGLAKLVMVKAPLEATPSMIEAAYGLADDLGNLRAHPGDIYREMIATFLERQSQ